MISPPDPPVSHPVIHIQPLGRMANQMIQYMAALKFASLVPGCLISNVNLPGWGITLPAIETPPGLTLTHQDPFDMEHLASRMNAGELACLHYQAFGQRLENFLDRAFYQRLFQAPQHQGAGFGPEYLLCHLRTGDLLTAEHRQYVLTPVAFYQEIIAKTGLQPVFMGETAPGPYLDSLRAAFPQALFLPMGDIIRDFETIRQSKNILVSCSSFCWLAAWLSEADCIHLPVNGMLNPRQHPKADLLPLQDPRYRFYLFPINYAVPEADHAARHRALNGMWRELSGPQLGALLAAAPRVPRRLEPFLEFFDETFYLADYPALRAAIAAGQFPDALSHYQQRGFADGLPGFAFDAGWYTAQYPMAAFEIAHGDYFDPLHHYVEIGHARGYEPLPPPPPPQRHWLVRAALWPTRPLGRLDAERRSRQAGAKTSAATVSIRT